MPSLYDDLDGGELEYKVIFKPIPLAQKPLLQEKGELKTSDPIYKGENEFSNSRGPHKAFPIKLKARQLYIISMERTAKDMDPYLMLEGPGNKIVATDDDSGGDSNARIIFQPRRAGDYRIIATVAEKEHVGGFTLTVRTTDE